ncbi:hypothetical protein ACWC2K_35240 [Streptomyces chattanoogensis]
MQRIGKLRQTAVGDSGHRLPPGVQNLPTQLFPQVRDLRDLSEPADTLGQQLARLQPELPPGEERCRREGEASLLRTAQYVPTGQRSGKHDLG